jgi:molecular chaperone HtpG
MGIKKEKHGELSIHSENIFPIIKKWLYSEHDIFLRELISNSVDALEKRKLVDENVKDDDLFIEIKLDSKKKRLQVIDYGIGMTEEEIEKYINQIAFSSAEDFVEKFKDKQSNIIGHFGLGFYSTYMVADKVTIDSLSYKEGSLPAYWECDGTREYDMGKGSRKKAGTTVTIWLKEDALEYVEEFKVKELIEKYSNFMPFDIKVGKDVVNQKEALWNRKPKDVSDEEYKEFYKKIFHDYQDPLFQIHLNVEYPFLLKGILYFPKINNQIDINKGEVKLYCNNVFVADNLKEIVPEFLLLLRGGIDIPEIPLNVSRSFLQNDKQVKKISQYIVKKVADSLKEIFKEDRKKYEGFWDDISNFIKYGVLTDEKFSEAIKDYLIFKTTNGDYVTIKEYLERNKSEDETKKIYYAPNEDTQVTYIELMKEQGIEVIYGDSLIDTHIFQHLELKGDKISFIRIDSEVNDNLIDKKDTDSEEEKAENVKLKEEFAAILDNKDITIEIKKLKTSNIPAMIVFNEQMRRFQEMNMMTSGNDVDMLKNHTLMINPNNKTIKNIIELDKKGEKEKAKLLTEYVHSLSMLEQKKLSGKDLKQFISRANKVLDLLD